MFWEHVINIAEYSGFFLSGYGLRWLAKKNSKQKYRCDKTIEVDETYHGRIYLPRCEHDLGHMGPCCVKVESREFHFDPDTVKKIRTNI